MVAHLSAVAVSRVRIPAPCKYCKAASGATSADTLAAAVAAASSAAASAAAVTVAESTAEAAKNRKRPKATKKKKRICRTGTWYCSGEYTGTIDHPVLGEGVQEEGGGDALPGLEQSQLGR